jgi:polysaccharide pyruvyl transferase WcaK-like protein
LKQKKDLTEVIKNCDLVIFGGGALLMDNWIFPLSLYYKSKLVRDLGLPYGVFGCSVGDSFSRFGNKRIKNCLDGAEFIVVRDHLSAVKLKQLGFKADGVCIDAAINTLESIYNNRGFSKGTVGINIMSYVRQRNLRKEAYSEYIKKMEETILQLDKEIQLGFQRIILFNTGQYDDMRTSLNVYSKVVGKLKNLEILITDRLKNLYSLCSVINNCDIVIGTRMHSCVIAKSYDVPIIGISWDKKIDGFFEMIGLGDFCLNLDEFSSDSIFDRIKRIKENNFVQESDMKEQIRDLKRNIHDIILNFR